MPQPASQSSALDRVLRSLPVVGLFHRCLEEERVGDLALLVLNFVMAVAVATLLGGWAAFISIVTVTAVIVLLALVLIASG